MAAAWWEGTNALTQAMASSTWVTCTSRWRRAASARWAASSASTRATNRLNHARSSATVCVAAYPTTASSRRRWDDSCINSSDVDDTSRARAQSRRPSRKARQVYGVRSRSLSAAARRAVT
ncbi:MAG: hypothetical protein NTV28_11955 [Propionibacteriales bacterium]|nr:hypothetical protein [Propionibacteriales bacterium]